MEKNYSNYEIRFGSNLEGIIRYHNYTALTIILSREYDEKITKFDDHLDKNYCGLNKKESYARIIYFNINSFQIYFL